MKTYNAVFDNNISSAMKIGTKVFRDFPASRGSIFRIMRSFSAAKKRRHEWRDKGVLVPPLLIISTTNRCNLSCIGCYANPLNSDSPDGKANELTRLQIDKLLDEAYDAGCSLILLAGGEPLLCDEWLEAAARRPHFLFMVFTNGTLIDERNADFFARNRHMIPLISIEGDADRTDTRRGEEVSIQIQNAMRLLKEKVVPFGISVTTGEHNVGEVANTGFVESFYRLGCRLAIFPEYVPASESNEMYVLSQKSKLELDRFCIEESNKGNMLLIAFPGDESMYDGCLAAGRGFAHISSSGELEPCPFANYSDRNVLDSSLIDALSSPLFNKIREDSNILHEGEGGCALRGKDFMFT